MHTNYLLEGLNTITSKSRSLTMLVLTIVVLVYQPVTEEIFSLSPAFERQEIKDVAGDWYLEPAAPTNVMEVQDHDGKIFHVKVATNISQCRDTDGFPFPDIAGVSYFSDGKSLNGTYWLTSPIIEPPLNDSLDTGHRKLVDIRVTDLPNQNTTLETFSNQFVKNLEYYYGPLQPILTSLGGKPAYGVVYNYSKEKSIGTSIWTIKDDKVYNFTYVAESTEFKDNLPTIRKMVNSFEFGQPTSQINRTDQFSKYENTDHGIRIELPSYWVIEEPLEGNKAVGFTSNLNRTFASLEIYVYPSGSIDYFYSKNMSLSQLVKGEINYLKESPVYEDFKLIESKAFKGSATIHMLNFTYNDTNLGETHATEFIFAKDGNMYILLYTAKSEKYSHNLSTILKMVDTFEIVWTDIKTATLDPNKNNTQEYFTYNDWLHGIKMQYPSDWTKKEHYDRNSLDDIVAFLSPLTYSNEPSLVNRIYVMSVDIPAFYEPKIASDYLVYITWNVANQQWVKTTREWSLTGERIFDEKPNYAGFFKGGWNYVQLSTDLNSFNNPDQYYLTLGIVDTFVKGGVICQLRDYSNWVALPPPKFQFRFSSANTSDIRPGEEKSVELQITPNTDLGFKVFLSANKIDGIDTKFIPNPISAKSGTTISHLIITGLENWKPHKETILVSANVNTIEHVPSGIRNFTSESENATIPNAAFLAINVLPPLRTDEILNNFYNTWITSVTGIWTFLAGVAAVIGPLAISLYNKKRKKVKEGKDVK